MAGRMRVGHVFADRELVSPDVAAFLSTCPNKGSGCFADRPEVLQDLRDGLGDAAIRAKGMRIAGAAIDAGREGIPVEEGTYPEITFEPQEGTPVTILGAGETRTLGEELRSRNYERTIACGYVCGQLAVSCPIVIAGKNE